MKSPQISLIALAAGVCAFHGAQAQTMPAAQIAQSESRDFAPDRWSQFTAAFDTLAGVRGKSDADDLLLLVCSEGSPGLDLSFHPADQSSLSESAEATLVFDGGAPVDAGMRAAAVFKNILFLLPDRDPNFGLVIEKLMSSKTVEIAIVESGTARSRHTFTLNGAAEAIAPALKLCGR